MSALRFLSMWLVLWAAGTAWGDEGETRLRICNRTSTQIAFAHFHQTGRDVFSIVPCARQGTDCIVRAEGWLKVQPKRCADLPRIGILPVYLSLHRSLEDGKYWQPTFKVNDEWLRGNEAGSSGSATLSFCAPLDNFTQNYDGSIRENNQKDASKCQKGEGIYNINLIVRGDPEMDYSVNITGK